MQVYETFYGFEGNAFRLVPDGRGTFLHESYTAAAASLLEAAKRGKGFALLIGASGTGKTTLVNEIAARLEGDGYFVGKVVNGQVDATDLLQMIGFAFGLQADAFSSAGLLTHLTDQLIGKGRQGRPTILIVDEAQDLTAAALEQLRLLCNLTADYGPVVQILLSGQMRLWERLRRPEHKQIRQLVVASCRLDPLSPAETRACICQALQLVGWKGDPELSVDALRLIHRHTGGVPRLINLTVGRLLLHGSLIEAHRLDAHDVESVLAQLGNDQPDLLLDTSILLLPSEPPFAQPLLPLDARAAKGPDHRNKPRWWAPFSPSALARIGEAATQSLKSGLNRLAGLDLKWMLSGLTAVVVSAYIVFRVGFEGDRSPPPTASEPAGGEASGIIAGARIDPSAAERRETTLESAVPLPLAAEDTDIVAAAEKGGGAPAQGSDRVEDGPETFRRETAPDESPEVFADISADTSKIAPEIDDSPLPRDAQEQDQSIQVRNEIEALLAKAEQAMSKNRLTVPSGDNAYAYYQEILALDPGNAQARAGIGRILHRYRQLAQQRLKRGDWREARRLASRGLKISPRDKKLRSIKRKASRRSVAKRQPRDDPHTPTTVPDVLRRIEEWFRSGRTNGSGFEPE